jgi:hypothetical protein
MAEEESVDDELKYPEVLVADAEMVDEEFKL